jgi:hypothetical protein
MNPSAQQRRAVVLYLDFDGVLHPDDVRLIKNQPVLFRDGMNLFEWAPLLEEALVPFPTVRVVLSTAWVRVKSFGYAKKQLPDGLQKRVVGATWHSQMRHGAGWYSKYHNPWADKTRHSQIVEDALRRGLGTRWVAVDDDHEGWNPALLDNFVQCDPLLGLAEPGKRLELQTKLEGLLAGDSNL